MIERRKSLMNQTDIYFWNPVIHWCVRGENIVIGDVKLPKKILELFVQMYSCTQNGISYDGLQQLDWPVEMEKVHKLFGILVKRNICIRHVNTPSQLFEAQSKLVQSKYSEEYFLNAAHVEAYRKLQLERNKEKKHTQSEISLNGDLDLPEFITARHSTRQFDTAKVISLEVFKNLLGVFATQDGRKYLYPSAGGLYPVNVYVYVKKGRIEGIAEGLYYYNPYYNSIAMIQEGNVISEDSQYFTNREIFLTSGITLYFTYCGDVNMTKYGGNGYLYGILDCGIMVGLVENCAQYLGLSSCSIGDMDFDSIKESFLLEEQEVYLHSIEIGYEESKR